MRSFTVVAVACLLALGDAPFAQHADALQAAVGALGAANVTTLEFTGSGAMFTLGRNFTPNDPWPRVTLKSYTARVNYATASMRLELLREMGARMPRGGGRPFTGEQRQIQLVSGTDGWDEPTPVSSAAADGPSRAQPQPEAAVARMLALWATPHGFVKAAMAKKATTRNVRGGTEVSFTVSGKYKMTGVLNRQNQVERVQTWIAEPLAGDLLVEAVYSGYKDFGGVVFPSRIVQSQGGYPTLDLVVASVQANPAVRITVPEHVRGAQPEPVRVNSEKLADGVYHLRGGGAHSLAIEMRDYIVLVDTPTNEPRALAVIAKAKELIRNKPVRFVVSTHHHWDHSGGIRAAMDEGATIVTHEIARAFFEKIATMPHTLVPDRLSTSKKAPKIQTVGGDRVQLTDGNRTVEVYEITGNEHAASLLMVYLPKERIIAQADAYDPHDPPSPPLLSVEVQKANALYENIQRRKLDVHTIASMHGARTTDMAELANALGKRPSAN